MRYISGKVKHILTRHEQAAAFAANGYARVKGTVGWCLATSGPGATNLVTGIADAYADSVPMIAITGQVPRGLVGSDAFQETDISGICLPITKKCYLLNDIKEAGNIFREAVEVALSGRPGPVLIDIPKDVQTEFIELDDNWEEQYSFPEIKRIYNVTEDDLAKVKDLMASAKKPLVLAGHGVLLSDAVDEIRAFTQRENIPAISTVLGIGVFDENDPLYFKWLGMHGMKYANTAVQEADLIIGLGMRFDDRITGRLKDFAPNAKIIHVDIDQSEHGKIVATKAFLHGDLKLVLQNVLDSRTEENAIARQEWVNHLTELKANYPLKKADLSKFTMISALDVLKRLSPDNVIVSTDVGQHQMWSAQYLAGLKPNHWLTSGGMGSMGFGFSSSNGSTSCR